MFFDENQYILLILTCFSSILAHLVHEYILCQLCAQFRAHWAHTYFVPSFWAHIFPTNENAWSLSCDLYCPITELEIVWKQILLKLVLNERYIILVYAFHSYLWFMSLIEDTGGWFWRMVEVDFVLKLWQMILNDSVLDPEWSCFEPVWSCFVVTWCNTMVQYDAIAWWNRV